MRRKVAIDWGFEITFFLVFTVIFLLVAYFWEQGKKEKKGNLVRVKCQCGYEYEGKTPPSKCPQCGKTLQEEPSFIYPKLQKD